MDGNRNRAKAHCNHDRADKAHRHICLAEEREAVERLRERRQGPAADNVGYRDVVVELRDYSVRSVTVGEDAQGEAHIEAAFNDKSYRGRGVSTDIIEASALAYLNALNRYLDEQRRRAETEKPTL